MSFSAFETSRSLGEPNTLIRFSFNGATYGYTDAEQEITFDGILYKTIPIDREPVSSSGTLDKAALKIRLPVNTDVAELFRVYPPSDVVGVTIFEGHSGDTDMDYKAVFVGRVLACNRNRTTATLSCEPISTSMKRPGLRRRYQHGCPHVLYGDKCKASEAFFSRTTTVTEASTSYVTLTNNWQGSFQKSRFAGGVFRWMNGTMPEIRSILKVFENENKLLLSGPVSGLAAGATVSVGLGCEHTLSDCRSTFNNAVNFGGQPWIPLSNPFANVNYFD